MKICDRCGESADIWTTSMFNEQDICIRCKEKERLHPLYKEAQRVEHEEVIKGNYKFKGIGLPKDLGGIENE